MIEVYKSLNGTDFFRSTSLSFYAAITNPLRPWLYPNIHADYGPQSRCVALATELCRGKEGDELAALLGWIAENIAYDDELAEELRKADWWAARPDEVLAAGKTVCFGSASLFAAMCRSQAIPCKIVVGRAAHAAGLHAWNEIFLAEEWLPVDAGVYQKTKGRVFWPPESSAKAEYFG